MKLIYLKEVDSTQKYLISKLKSSKLSPPVCVWSDYQTNGIGSRGNKWIGKRGNLFFSFAYKNEFKVPLESLSIYFGWLFKKSLNKLGSNAVMKWPNDIYLIDKEPKKIGGVITNLVRDFVVCGIGLNTSYPPSKEFGCLDIKVKNDKILQNFFDMDFLSWEEVFCEYKKEFKRTKAFFGIEGRLLNDGSLEKNRQRIYSNR